MKNRIQQKIHDSIVRNIFRNIIETIDNNVDWNIREELCGVNITTKIYRRIRWNVTIKINNSITH